MYKQCSTNRTISRQRELEGEILKIISHKHFEKLSVVDLCEYLNIPRKAFYRYFSSKEGALYAIIDHALTDALENFFQLQESAASAEQILRDFFRYWKSQRGLLDVLAYNDLSGLLLQRAINFSFGSSEISRKIFPARNDSERDYIAVFFISGIISLVIQWHHGGFDRTPEQLAETAVRFIYHPELTLK